NGYANLYYAAGVRSMLRSLHNFFFVSFDPGGLVSIDKPPLGLWLQAASAKLFGFGPLALLVPEGVCAVLAVALLYFVIARRLGVLAGLLAALALAVFPSFVAVSRDNTLDPLLLLLMLAGCALALGAIESGRTRTLLASALLIGLAFNTKSLAAFVCVPGIALGYLVCAPAPLRRRIAQLLAAGAVLALSSLSWSLIVDAVPASQRPYVGSSSDNSELGLEFGYNGLGRTGGQVGGPPCPEAHPAPTSDIPVFHLRGARSAHAAAASPAAAGAAATGTTGIYGVTVRDPDPVAFGSCPSPLRIFGVGLGDQGGWSVPLAVIGLLALALAVRGWRDRSARRDPRVGLLFVLGGWFAIELLALDFSRGIVHPYYVSDLAPALAAMVGAGAAGIATLLGEAERRRRLAGLAAAVAAAVTTVGIDLELIRHHGYPEFWRYPMVALAALALGGAASVALGRAARGRASWAAAALVVVLLVAPALYASSVWDAPVDGTFPAAGPYNEAGYGGVSLPRDEIRANDALAAYVRTHRPAARFALLTEASDASSPLILMGLDAAAMGGYNSTDRSLTAAGLASLVAHHEARYVLVGGPYFDRGGDAASNAARLVCPQVPQAQWYPSDPVQGTLHLVDCAGRAGALRHPFAVARAYLRRHPRRLAPISPDDPTIFQDTSGLRSRVSVTIGGAAAAVKITLGAALAPRGGLANLTPSGALEPARTVYRARAMRTAQTVSFTLPADWHFKVAVRGATFGDVIQRFG
ncbi:MAG TPA: glycosyltransferase family 39 protein, partial [Solirubrobacteraceae bacterium]|nr:glycosyltransferase family 39 protein [Solirubrobacteraceae bacterium]